MKRFPERVTLFVLGDSHAAQRSTGGGTRPDVPQDLRCRHGEHDPVDMCRHPLDLTRQDTHGRGQCVVPGDRTGKEFGPVGNAGLPLQADLGEVFPV